MLVNIKKAWQGLITLIKLYKHNLEVNFYTAIYALVGLKVNE